MSYRQAPLVSQLATRVDRFVRTCASVVEPPTTDSPGGTDEAPADRERGTTHYSRTAPSIEETELATLVDPDTGPTSRTEVLEHGLTPEEYVCVVLEHHDGRAKQCRFTNDYGWSPATVSRLLSDLEDRGAVERYRLGREKVVCLPDVAPETETS